MKAAAAVWEDINSLVMWEQNPRHNNHAIQSVADSIKRFGFGAPIVAREADKMVIAGHTRLEAAKRLGLDRVPVRYLDLDPADAKMLALADNKIGELADWDGEALEKIIDDLGLSVDDMADLGWSSSDLDDLFDPDFDAVDEEPIDVRDDVVPDSKLGDVYRLGSHTLVCGDCKDVKNWPKKEGDFVLFTSPPYMATNASLSANSHLDKKYLHKEETGIDFLNLMKSFTDISMNSCSQLFVNTQFLADNKTLLIEYLSFFKESFCDLLIWDKGNTQPAMARNVCNSDFEIIFVFSKTNNSRSMRFADFRGTVSNIIRQPPNRHNDNSDIHSAVMSGEFCDYVVKIFCKRADMVVDCFGGVGTTMMCCERQGKISWLIEKSPIYCDAIRRRWFKYATEHNLDVGDGLDG